VIDFEDFNPEIFTKHSLIIICVATHYEGDPCDNTKKFYKWFREQTKKPDSTSIMKGVNYTLFGLGDTSYEMFNAIGR
jgi:sulfite reductase alpha subunit-like flavoprotein